MGGMKGFRTAVPPLLNVPLWHMDYLELKALEILWAQEKLLPLTTQKQAKLRVFPRITVINTDKF